MPLKLKFQVVLAFAFRLPLIAISVLHLVYFAPYPTSQEPQFAVAKAMLFQQTMVTWAIISATIPNMKSFMKSFSIDMNFPANWGNTTNDSNSYPLQSLTNRSTNKDKRQSGLGNHTRDDNNSTESDRRPVLRPDVSENHTAVTHRGGSVEQAEDAYSIGKSSTQELIITRQVQWSIHHES